MTWRRTMMALLATLVLGLAPLAAEAADEIDVKVLVCHATAEAGGVDGACRALDAKIGSQFRYESLRKLQGESLSLALNALGSVSLPNGKSLKIRPLQVDGAGALLAVDVEGAVRTDVKVSNGNLVVIGADAFEDGKLVISLEPRW